MGKIGDRVYDVVIIGGGPAGLTAGLYASRSRLSALLIERGNMGGQASTTHLIENYPGFPGGISGPELGRKMEEQARHFGLEGEWGDVTALAVAGPVKEARLGSGRLVRGRAAIIATGAEPRKLGVPGEDRFRGFGVSYCATCDGAFYRDASVLVVGGGDAAVEEALFLTRYARQVTIVHRRDRLRAVKVIQERAMAHEKIRFRWDSVVEAINGGDRVETVTVRNIKTGESGEIPADGVFVYIGMLPNAAFVPPEVERDEQGYLRTDAEMRTSVEGVFAAGDVRSKALRQVATAVGDGAVAAMAAERYLSH